MRSLKVSGIIHLFAVLHAVVALSCHLAGINDELVLTLLTIVLIVLICLKRGLNVEFTAASVIVVNVIGYLLGTGGAQLIELLLHAPPVVHAVSTFITTEILGWSIVWFTKLFRRGDDTASRSSAWTPRIGLLLLAVGVIFVLRLAYVELFTSPSFSTDRLYHMADLLVSNSAALIILLCVNIIYVRHTRRRETRHGPIAEIAAFLLFVLLTSACVALITGLHLPFAFDRSFTAREFLQLWIITLLVEVILYSVVFMVDYALVARAVLRAERGKAHQAQFRYMKLKQQVNPHFLFNTLNNIYALVALNPQQAQYALHSLSQLLRYVLYDNNQQMMPLSKELAFIRSYVELMSLRLSKQVQLEVNLPEDDRGYQVAPLLFIALIENAFKHGVSATEPSFIHISFALTGGDTLICTVENSCFPKNELDRSGSGIGLENLRRRLSLLYPGQHILRMEKIGEQYVAQLILTLKPHVQDSEIGSK